MIAESTLNSKPFQNAIFNSQFITQNEIITLRVSTRQEKLFFFQIFLWNPHIRNGQNGYFVNVFDTEPDGLS